MNRLPLILLSLAVAVAAIGFAAYYRYTHPLAVATTQPTTLPATTPVPIPATTQAVKRTIEKGPATQLLDIVRARDPRYPTTQRLPAPLDLRYAARIVLDDPTFLDSQGNLWITRPDAPEAFNFLKASASETATHLLRDAVVFVAWTSTDNGLWLPHLVVRNPAGPGYQLLDYDGRRPLEDPLGFRWERALVLPGRHGAKDRIIVPTATGVCAFAFDQTAQTILQSHQRLIEKDAADRAVQLVMDVTGVIAYVTNAAGTRGATGVARYAPIPAAAAAADAAGPTQYKWALLSGAGGWPDHILHLVPLLDGSVLQVRSADDPQEKDKVVFSLDAVADAAAAAVDEPKVLALVDDLSADNPDKREAAFKKLTTYGPGIAPLLEKSLDGQPAEAQIRIRQLLKNKVEPSLGGMSVVENKLRVVNRLPDGGVIFFAEAGVAIPRPDDTPTYVAPAWLSIRPGRAVELLPASLLTDLNPDKHRIIAWGLNDYVVLDPVLGPQWYIGNHLEPLLRKAHRQFAQFDGIDSTGRWIFRAPAAAAATTKASTSAFSTLIIDPRLPDPTPRLPGWQLPPSAGKVGWDKNDWPVIYMDAKPNPVPWALEESAWRVIDEKKEKVFTEPGEVPAPKRPTTRVSTRPIATTASTAPAQDSAVNAQDFLLSTPDGDCFYGGQQSLRLTRADGVSFSWPLPESAIGAAKPVLLRSRDNLLFLVNEPGRIVRIRPTPDAAQPFAVDAVFTRGVPSDAAPQRVWLDPADRICIAHDQNRITILFTIGRIPPPIAEKMRPEDFPPDEQ